MVPRSALLQCVILSILAPLMAAATGVDELPTPAPGCGLAAHAPGSYEFTLEHDGLERTYGLHIPESYDDRVPTPLLLSLHSFFLGGNKRFIYTVMSQQVVKMQEAGFILLTPDGIGPPASWNGGELCCGPAQEEDIDDVGFITALIDQVASELCIDERRVYATGMSNGGYLSHRLACERPDRISAIAPIVGSFSPELVCSDGRAVPVLQISGSEDSLASRQQSVDRWVELNDCSESTRVSIEGEVTCTTHDDCRDGVEVTHCVVGGGAHCIFSDYVSAFQPNCQPRDDITSQHLVWDFVSQWRLPAPKPAPLPGDADLDGVVDADDYRIWADNYGKSPAVFTEGDFNGDERVNGGDYTVWADAQSNAPTLEDAMAGTAAAIDGEGAPPACGLGFEPAVLILAGLWRRRQRQGSLPPR